MISESSRVCRLFVCLCFLISLSRNCFVDFFLFFSLFVFVFFFSHHGSPLLCIRWHLYAPTYLLPLALLLLLPLSRCRCRWPTSLVVLLPSTIKHTHTRALKQKKHSLIPTFLFLHTTTTCSSSSLLSCVSPWLPVLFFGTVPVRNDAIRATETNQKNERTNEKKTIEQT